MILESEQDTSRLAACIAHAPLCGGMTLALKGGLGAGKTTLVRYLVHALGGKASHVASPSYTLQNEYVLHSACAIEHWDLYRLTEAPEELFEPPSDACIRIVEWPERASELLNDAELWLDIKVRDDGTREVTASGPLANDVVSRYGRKEAE